MRWLMGMALRNVLRNKRRSALTMLTVLLGTALLTLGLSWLNGLMGMIFGGATDMAGEVRVVTEAYAKRQATLPLYENVDPVEPLIETIQEVHPTARVHPTIKTAVTLTVGEDIGDHFGLLVAAEEAYFRDVLELSEGIEQGAYFSGGAKEALLGRALAAQIDAKVGDDLVVLGQTQDGSPSPLKLRVQGVVNGGNSLADRQVFVPFSEGQWLADFDSGATEVLVYGGGYMEAADVASALRKSSVFRAYESERMAECRAREVSEDICRFRVEAWSEREPYSGIYTTVTAVFAVLAVIIVFVTALGVLNTMIMSVMERSAEIGVLRAMGLRKRGVVGMFVMEGVLIGLVGAGLGLVLGMVPSVLLEVHGIHLGEGLTSKTGFPLSTTVHADFTWAIAGLSAALGILTALLGSLLPAVRASAIEPVNAMRRRR